jgi:peroxiredoxin
MTRHDASMPATTAPRGVMRGGRLVALALSAVAVIAGCAGPAAGADAGSAAPANVMTAAGPANLAFEATTLDGAPFDGSSLRGRPTVLWFWAAWCSVCAGEAPSVAKVAAANPGVRFIGVSALDELPAMKQFVADRGVGGFTQLADKDAAVWRRFGVTSQPAQAFITASGAVRLVPGVMSQRVLAQQVAALNAP